MPPLGAQRGLSCATSKVTPESLQVTLSLHGGRDTELTWTLLVPQHPPSTVWRTICTTQGPASFQYAIKNIWSEKSENRAYLPPIFPLLKILYIVSQSIAGGIQEW